MILEDFGVLAAVGSGQEVAHEYEARRWHSGVASEQFAQVFHHGCLVQPNVREEHEHGVAVLFLQLLELSRGFDRVFHGSSEEVDVAEVGSSRLRRLGGRESHGGHVKGVVFIPDQV